VPIYDYLCTACGHRLEVVHGIHGHGPEACPACAGTMRKAMVTPAIHFKGSGWAKKDRGAATRTKAAAKADADSAAPSAKAGETAPASAGETAPAGGSETTPAPASGPVTPSGGTD
jgi:putative FmdB family regulatory protein